MEFLKGNLWEIKKSSSLRVYGLLLSLSHVLVFTDWTLRGKLPLALASSKAHMCWPVFESCGFIRVFSDPLLSFVFGCYLAFAILTALLTLSTRITGAAWFTMFITTTLQMCLYFQDYRLSTNIMYLHILCSLVWLFLPNKTNSLKLLIVSFFLGKGLIMLSPEWLIGKSFLDAHKIPEKLAEWLAALSAMTVLIAPVSLFFKDLRYFLSGLLVMISYLAALIFSGGFLEPSLLLVLIMIFPMDLFEQRKLEREFIYQSFIRPEPSKVWPWLLVSLFWFAQAIPRIPVQWPKYLESFGTLYSLTPIPPHRECKQFGFYIHDKKIVEIPTDDMSSEVAGGNCDAYRRFLKLKELCSQKAGKNGFRTIESYLYVRGLKDPTFQPEFESKDICRVSTTFKTVKAEL